MKMCSCGSIIEVDNKEIIRNLEMLNQNITVKKAIDFYKESDVLCEGDEK